jgi:hypothetical protein
MPRETAPGQYQQENEQRYRQQVDDELLQKHDRRSDLRLGRGKSLVIASESGLEFALALDDDGFITVTNYSTGEVGELTVRFDNVEGLAQEFIDIRAEFAAADTSLSSAYIAADAVVAADAESANATLSTTLTAAYQAADSTVASNAAALVTSEAGTRASADSALAARASALEATVNTPTTGLTARVTTAEAAIVSGDAANAASITSLTATVNTKARTFVQTSAPTATATGDIWFDSDDNNKAYRWSGSAWVAVDDVRITTNAAAITTESAARASGDSANATSITTLTATFQQTAVRQIPMSPTSWMRVFLNLSVTPDNATDADNNSGIVWNTSEYFEITGDTILVGPKYGFPAIDGRIYEVTADVEVTASDGACNPRLAAYSYQDNYTVTSASNFSVFAGSTIATGRTTLKRTFGINNASADQAVADLSTVKRIRFGAGCASQGASGVVRVYSMTIRDVTSEVANTASVSVTASAVADIEGRLEASYAIQVDGGGNGALVSLEDGTELGSVVKLAADRIELAAPAINFGDDTVYEDTHNTFYTESASYRYRDRGPFGASGDLLVWYGPTSVSLNSETKTNGVFSIATDGIVRYGSAELLTVGGNNSRAKVLGPAALSFSANSTWQEFATLDVSDVASGSFISMPFVDIVGQSQSAVTIGAGYQWRMTEAPTSSPTTKTVVKSGNFTVTAGSGGDPPTVDSIDQPSAQLVAVTNTGSVRYKLEIQRTSGTATIGLQATANFIINPG